MKLFRTRPLMLCSLCAVLCSIGALFLPRDAKIVVFCLLFALSAAFLFLPRRGCFFRATPFVFSLLFALCGVCVLSSFLFFNVKLGAADRYSGTHSITARVTDTSYSSYGCEAIIESVDGRDVSIHAYLRSDSSLSVNIGCVLSAAAELSPLEEYSGFDYSYVRGDGVFTIAEVSDVVITGERISFFNSINNFCRRSFYSLSEYGGFLSCVFAGNRSDAGASVSSDFSSLGISHLLAVSGLHITALLAGAEFVIRRIIGKSRWVFSPLAALAVLYALVVGLSGSVVRAAVMYLILRAAPLFFARADSPTSLCFAGACILSACPYALYDTGLLLSFSATAGIILIGAPLARSLGEKITRLSRARSLRNALKYLCSSLCVTLSALLFTVPAASLLFGTFTPATVLWNLLFCPLITVILYLCPFFVLFSGVPLLGAVFGWVADGLCGLTLSLASFLSDRAAAPISLRLPFVIPLLLVAAASALVLLVLNKLTRRSALALCGAFVVVFTAAQLISLAALRNDDEILYLRGKTGDYLCVISENRASLVSCGEGYSDLSPVYDRLLRRGIASFDSVVFCRSSSRAASEYERVESEFRVKRALIPEQFGSDACAFELMTSLFPSAEVFSPRGGISLSVGNTSVRLQPLDGSPPLVYCEKLVFSPGAPAAAYPYLSELDDGCTIIYGSFDSADFYPVFAGCIIIGDEDAGRFVDPDYEEHNIIIYKNLIVFGR